MNKGIYKQLIAILFLGFLSTYAGEIKSEETCSFAKPEEYEKCFNDIAWLRSE